MENQVVLGGVLGTIYRLYPNPNSGWCGHTGSVGHTSHCSGTKCHLDDGFDLERCGVRKSETLFALQRSGSDDQPMLIFLLQNCGYYLLLFHQLIYPSTQQNYYNSGTLLYHQM